MQRVIGIFAVAACMAIAAGCDRNNDSGEGVTKERGNTNMQPQTPMGRSDASTLEYTSPNNEGTGSGLSARKDGGANVSPTSPPAGWYVPGSPGAASTSESPAGGTGTQPANR